MTDQPDPPHQSSWIDTELEDILDEELELEIDDLRFPEGYPKIADQIKGSALNRRTYFRELIRLQSELVALQDWVVANGFKLVVLFEGRDAAGKGGVIKRISQRLNPRICRTVALSAPSEREESQWYF